MRSPWIFAAACAAALWPVPEGSAGWGAAFCAPVGAPARLPHAVTHEWRTDDQNLYRLYRNRVHVADYDWTKDEFRYLGQAPSPPPWGARAKPEPQPARAEPAPIPNFGIDLSQLRAQGEAYRINGRDCTRQQAWEAIESGQLTDDAHRQRITVIGSEAERKQVLDDLASNPALVSLKDKVLIQSYAPDHWAVSRVGFFTGGHPTIYYQQPDGKVLHRQDDYQGGAQQLAEAIRKADPNYRPDQDKDKRKPDVLPDLSALPPWVFAVAGVSLLLLLTPAPREQHG